MPAAPPRLLWGLQVVALVRCLEPKLLMCHMGMQGRDLASSHTVLPTPPQVPVEGNLWGPCDVLSPSHHSVSELGLSVIPQASWRKGCLKLWRGCTGPGRVLSCPATKLLNQLKKTFLHRVRGKYPGQLEIGGFLPVLSSPPTERLY